MNVHSALNSIEQIHRQAHTGTPIRFPGEWEEHDSCAIVASIRKKGIATHGNLKRVLDALSKMGHRSGEVNGEGDGCGVLTDIPRKLWAEALEKEGKPGWLAEDKRFFVGHLMIPNRIDQPEIVQEKIIQIIRSVGAELLIERPALVRPLSLGRLGRLQAPHLWQIAGQLRNCPLEKVEDCLFDLTLTIERETDVHVASLSSYSVVYKVRGTIETLYHYYPELRSPDYMTAITLGHARYSTNTATAFERVQPFSLLGHNGEINTIARLREQAAILGVQLPPGGSDSQDLDRILGDFIHHQGLTLMESLEMLFPPIMSEVEKLPTALQSVYRYYRQAFGPFAQGPASLISRYQDECALSVDALGLRPLWYGETEKEIYFSSEKGVYHLDTMLRNPRPLSPGEKMVVRLYRNDRVEVLEYAAIQQEILSKAQEKHWAPNALIGQQVIAPLKQFSGRKPSEAKASRLIFERALAAFGWGREDREWIQELAAAGKDPIGSLGFDGPLAALSAERQNLADYFKETVAVVTNPSIDQEREADHFSTQCVLGKRPSFQMDGASGSVTLTLECPILIADWQGEGLLSVEEERQIAAETGAMRLADLLELFGESNIQRLSATTLPGETLLEGLHRLGEEAVSAVTAGAALLILDDSDAFQAIPSAGQPLGWIDPLLALSAVENALRTTSSPSGNLRRQTGLVLCSAAVRHLHDLIMMLGAGADAVAPSLLLQVALDNPQQELSAPERSGRLRNTLHALKNGLEKVASTMGIHELRGYGRLFSSIGLSLEVAALLGTVNYAGSETGGVSWQSLEADRATRLEVYSGRERAQLSRLNHFASKIWKKAAQVARGEADGEEYEMLHDSLAKSQPVSLRHVIDVRFTPQSEEIHPDEVDAGITGHALPFVISSMSFGSQSEMAFRAYAQAAYWLNILAINGEGGEISDMLGYYPHNRGIQIASGRFGITADVLNAANLIEIKVGQGAKPGEGGHLPGRKVSAKIAATRHAQPGSDLISPANNHDVYSIEDLAQFIEELKTANPKARVAVKVPVVPGIGIIAVGIAKAGADIINLSGYDGGTGAARRHAIQHVGLPAEIGVVETHRLLTEAGLRHKVELWCDGGMRSAADALKMICLGANRIGFGTLAMVAVGCTICRACETGACHVGIATQIETRDQAAALGLKRFEPCDPEQAVSGLVRLFQALSEQLRKMTARLGFRRVQDLVGRADLLVQGSHFDRLDLQELLTPLSVNSTTPGIIGSRELYPSLAQQSACHETNHSSVPLRRPRNHLTTVISNLVMETLTNGEELVNFEDDKVSPVDRVLGTHLSGALTRYQRRWMWTPGHGGVGGSQETWRMPLNPSNGNGRHLRQANLRFYASSVPGNGLGAYNVDPIHIIVEGGAQDGVAKGMRGGRVVILKGFNHDGRLIDGSVGKSLAYGATGGLVIVQGNADTRACIRLSGADVIIGGEITEPLCDHLGFIGARSNVKGFLCEYMTAGRVLVLGDPGPWMCAGMTGGVLYLYLQPHFLFDQAAIRRRLARSARVNLSPVDQSDERNLCELLTFYSEELSRNHQPQAAQKALDLLNGWKETFIRVAPTGRQMDQTVSTE